ncbi:MAG: M48 family metalloprotease, partial [Ilumatobacteraceae bacterium]
MGQTGDEDTLRTVLGHESGHSAHQHRDRSLWASVQFRMRGHRRPVLSALRGERRYREGATAARH